MDGQIQRSGTGMVRRLAVLLGSAALLLPLAESVGQRTGAVAHYLLAMAATAVATPVRAQTEVRIVSIERQDPTTSPTNADSLKWRITFSETTSTSGSADLLTSEFTVSSTPTMATPPTVTNVQPVNISQSVYDVTVSGGDLVSFNGTVTLGIANPNTIQEQVMGTFLTNLTPTGTNDNSYVVANITPTVTISGPLRAVEEGNDLTFTLTLDEAAPIDLTVDVTVAETEDMVAGTDEESRMVTVMEGRTQATFTVATQNDGVVEEVSVVTVTVMADGDIPAAYEVGSPSEAMVTVFDTDERGVVVSRPRLTVNEGGTGDYTVVLTSQPTGEVTITLVSDNDDVTLVPTTLTFTADDWSTAQDVMVSAASDADNVNDSATISHTVMGADYEANNVEAASVGVTVSEVRLPVVSIAAGTLPVSEGTAAVFTLTRTGNKANELTVEVAVEENGAVLLGAAPSSVTFDAQATTAIFSVPTHDDEVDEDDGVVTVMVTADIPPPPTPILDFDSEQELIDRLFPIVATGTYVLGKPDSASVTVNDNDPTPVVTLLLSPDTIDEATGMSEIRAMLSGPSAVETLVTVLLPAEVAGAVELGADPVLTIAPGMTESSNAVTLTAVDNDVEAPELSVTVSGMGSNTVGVTDPAPVTLTITDDETMPMDTTPPMVTYTEPSPLVVGTAIRPISPMTTDTDIASYSATDLPAGLMIDPTSGVISGTPTTASASTATATVTVTDNAGNEIEVTLVFPMVEGVVQPGVSAIPTRLNPTGEGTTTAYTVTLNTLPPGTVTITPTSGDSSAVSVSPASLAFTTANWNTPQAVTVTGVEDDDTTNETVTISHSVSGYGTVSVATAVTVTVTDDDVPEVSDNIPEVNVEISTLTVSEGSNGAYTLVLNTPPPGTVTITPTSGDSGAVSVSPASLAFTTANWNTPQTVTVTGVEDDDTTNETVTISHSVSGYGTVSVATAVTVTVTDDDVPEVSDNIPEVNVEISTLTVSEGSNGAYTLVLNTPPPGTVTITPTSGDSGAVSVSPASLAFTTANWNTPQAVTVTGVEDDDTTNETVTISHSVSGYGTVSVATAVTVTVTDDDVPEVSDNIPEVNVEISTLTVSEGSNGAYTLVLNTPPPGTVTITPTSGDSGAVSVSPASLAFTTANWNTPQTVTVTGVEDDDTTNETVTISHSVSGYGTVSVATAVTVTVTDDDTTQEEAETSETAKEEAEVVLEEVVLPDMVQQLTARTTEVITSRLNTVTSGSSGDPLTISLEEVLADTVAVFHGQQDHLKNGSLEWRQALSGRDFAFPLSGFTLAQGDIAGGKEHPFSSLAVWGGADYSSYGNTIEDTDVDGNGFSGVIGMDLQPTPRLVTGLALTTSRWGLDYTTDTTDTHAEGTYEMGVTTVNPYVNWLATDQLSLWATFGYGRGEVEQTPEEGNATTRTDGLTSWAGGVRFEVVPGMDPLTGEGSPIALAFKADGATSSFLDTQVQLARLAAEVSRSFAVESGLLSAALELGWRLRSVSDKDGLDALQQRVADKNHSGGAELAGSLNWLNTDGSLSAEVDTRVVLGGGHHREWGMGGHLRFAPSRRAGEGLSLTLQPSFGVTGTRLDELWSLSGDGDLAISNDPPGGRLDAELAYGFPLGDALLTPYTEVAWEEGGSAYGAGLRYGLNPFLELDLKGAHRSGANGNPENRLLLDMRSHL